MVCYIYLDDGSYILHDSGVWSYVNQNDEKLFVLDIDKIYLDVPVQGELVFEFDTPRTILYFENMDQDITYSWNDDNSKTHRKCYPLLDCIQISGSRQFGDGKIRAKGDVYAKGEKLATLQEVKTEVANLVNSAPETLDTLGELAKALNDNKDVTKVLNEAIGTKVGKQELANNFGVEFKDNALDFYKSFYVHKLSQSEGVLTPQTITIGTNELLGTDPVAISLAIRRLFLGEWKCGGIPELWDGHAAERIVSKLCSLQ